MYVVSLLRLVVRRLGARRCRTVLITAVPILSAHSVADTFAGWPFEFLSKLSLSDVAWRFRHRMAVWFAHSMYSSSLVTPHRLRCVAHIRFHTVYFQA